MSDATRCILDYLWNKKEYEEWDERYLPRNDGEKEKQESHKTAHQIACINAWNNISPLWGRRLIVDGVVYYISPMKDDYNWKKLITVQQHGVVEESA